MKKIIFLFSAAAALMSFQVSPRKTATTPVRKPAAAVPGNTMAAVMDRGKTVYLTQCLSCHQVDGGGVPHLNAPLDGASAVQGKDKAKLIRIVLTGMKGVELDGEFYSNAMAPHPELTDQQIADALTYIRNSWSNKAGAVTAAEVKAVRAKTK